MRKLLLLLLAAESAAFSQMPLPPLQKYYLASEDESAALHSEHLKSTKSIPWQKTQ